MIRFVRSASILILGSTLMALGCGSGGGSSSSGAGGSSTTSGDGSGTTAGTGPSCAMMCSSGQDCQSVACNCGDGSVINTSACNNACCATEAEACPDSCKDNGGWGSSGTSGSTGGGPTGAAFGEDCTANADCQSGICFHVDPNDETVQKCTKACTFGGGECDAGWDCSEITNGGDTTYLCIVQ